MDLKQTDWNLFPGNPVACFAGQILIHPSLICQIGASDQGLSEVFSTPTAICTSMLKPTFKF